MVIIQKWVFHAFLEMERRVRRERQALSAVTALVTWLGFIVTTALALAGSKYEKK